MADIVNIRFFRPTGIIQSASVGYLRRQAVSPMALNVTDNQAVAIIREKKIINAEIAMNNAQGMKGFESSNQVENPSLVDGDRAIFVLPKDKVTRLEFMKD